MNPLNTGYIWPCVLLREESIPHSSLQVSCANTLFAIQRGDIITRGDVSERRVRYTSVCMIFRRSMTQWNTQHSWIDYFRSSE